MDRSPLIRFKGQRDPSGYHFADSEYGRLIVANSDRRVWCQPLTGDEFRVFANIAGNPEGALDFVQQYGPVSFVAEKIGDRVEGINQGARAMRRLLDAVADRQWMSDERAENLTKAPLGLGMLNFGFVWDPARKAPVWSFQAMCLRDALWLQFGQAMMRGAQLRACLHCADWFEAGVGTGRRADAKFCSDEHRVAFNSLKRSKGD